MCGIAGVVALKDHSVDHESLRRMGEELRTRGPDECATWVGDGVGLVHTRLSIIDLAGSHQPMASNDEMQVLAFNGEILNYRELRQQWTSYPYRTRGDTEVILAAHREAGDLAPMHLSGQFAYALHDRRDRTTVLVRDRLGILPLYWWKDDTKVIFASSVMALLRAVGHTPDLDPAALHDYLGTRAVRAPRTLLKGVRKLRAGHTLTISTDGSAVERPYWQPALSENLLLSAERAVDQLDSYLTRAVQRAMLADVPVGAYLSGGVDSSLIAAKAVGMAGRDGIHTFCATFGDHDQDEAPVARRVSDLPSTRHHEVLVTARDFERLWAPLSVQRGAPLSEPADIAVYLLARAAKHEVKVVLSGEGSDELFAGYPKHRFASVTASAGLLPDSVRKAVARAIRSSSSPRTARLKVASRALAESTYEDRLRGWFAPFTRDERDKLIGEHLQAPAVRTQTPLKAMLANDLVGWLPDNLLARGDTMSMAASVELRPPFLDHDVVDFALALPRELLIRRATGKWLVKQVALRYLPPDVAYRPKVGFRVPLDGWFRDSLEEFARDHVWAQGSVARSHLDIATISDIFERHAEGSGDESIRIWTLASLEVWHASLRAALLRPAGSAK